MLLLSPHSLNVNLYPPFRIRCARIATEDVRGLLYKENVVRADDAVQMILVEQGLTPGVEHGREAELSPKLVIPELKQCRIPGLKEQRVERCLVLRNGRVEGVRHSEEEMEVVNRQEQLRVPGHRVRAIAAMTT